MSTDKTPCRFFAQNASCRYGSECKFFHSQEPVQQPQQQHSVPVRSGREPVKWQASTSRREVGKEKQFRLMSYNTLADTLAQQFGRDLYMASPPSSLPWWHRGPGILSSISRNNPDIGCLQEVDHPHFFQKFLHGKGYASAYLQKTGDRVDGCLTFWKAARFVQCGLENVRFAEYGLRDNVALVVALQGRAEVAAGNGHRLGLATPQGRVTGPILVIGNTHILFNTRRGDIKLGQARVSLGAMHRLASSLPGPTLCMLCGDFNSTPDSGLIRFMAQGQLDLALHDRSSLGGQHEGTGCGWPHNRGIQAALAERQRRLQSVQSMSSAHATPQQSVQRTHIRFRSPEPAVPVPPLLQGQRPCDGGTPGYFGGNNCPAGTSNGGADSNASGTYPWPANGLQRHTSAPPQLPPYGAANPPARAPALTHAASLNTRLLSNGCESGLPTLTHRWTLEEVAHALGQDLSWDAASKGKTPSPQRAANTRLRLTKPLYFKSGLLQGECVARHDFSFRSAYREVTGAEPIFTSCHGRFTGTVDYIWYTDSSEGWRLTPTAVLLTPEIHSLTCGLPAPGWPSDHVALVADFVLQEEEEELKAGLRGRDRSRSGRGESDMLLKQEEGVAASRPRSNSRGRRRREGEGVSGLRVRREQVL